MTRRRLGKGTYAGGILLVLLVAVTGSDAVSTATLCPATTGYTRALNLVTNVNTLDGPYTRLADAVAACNGRGDCYGVSGRANATVFYITSTIPVPGSVEVGSCTFAKTTPASSTCPSRTGYQGIPEATVTTVANFDGATYASAAAARLACEADKDCYGFIADGTTFKTLLALFPMEYKRNACVYVKLPTPCGTFAGYTPLSDMAVPAGSAEASSPTNAKDAFAVCRFDSQCKGFSSTGDVDHTGTPVYARGKCYHQKAYSTVCPSVPGFAKMPDADLNVANIGVKTSLAEAVAACYEDSTCKAVSSDKWKLRPDASMIYKYGTCLYQLPTASEGDVRLVPYGTDITVGRMEIYHNSVWGTICDAGATDVESNSGRAYGDILADVFCKQLDSSYSEGALLMGVNAQVPGTGSILLSNATCDPTTAARVDQCLHSGWTVDPTCLHAKDLGVSCAWNPA